MSAFPTTTVPLPLASGWRDFGSEYSAPTISRSGDIVTLEGLVTGGGAVIANLPKEFRPRKRLIFPANTHEASCRVDLLPDGSIQYVAGPVAHQWISLGGITFISPYGGDAGTTTDPIPVSPGTGGSTTEPTVDKDGYNILDGGYSVAGVTKVASDGVIHLTEATTVAFGGVFFNVLPSAAQNISFSFDYFSGNGASGGADGFCFFLADGEKHDGKTLGAVGGNLGYTGVPAALPFAYLGIGFDEFGNFGQHNPTGQKVPSKDMVVVRAGGDGKTGYDILTYKSVAPNSIDGGWRHAEIHLDFTGSSTIISVSMKWYKDNSDKDVATQLVVFDKVKVDQKLAKPNKFRLGLSAATGGATNQHYVKNLKVLYRTGARS